MSKKILVVIIILEAFIGGLAILFIISSLWYAPLGPSLGLPAAATEQVVDAPEVTTPEVQGEPPLPDPTQTPASIVDRIAALLQPATPASNALCGGPEVMTILVVGSDERENDYSYGLADSIRAVRIDFTTPSLMVLDIPRDLWVEIPDISDHKGINQGKINQAYFYGNTGMGYYDGPGEGPGLLARTLDLNFGLKVDHYLAMNRPTFQAMIDTLGGVDIYINNKIDLNDGRDGANPDYVLEPGYHHLDGELALKLALDRYPTIFQRARYQNIVLAGLQDKLFSPAVIPELPQLVSQFTRSVQTDFSPSDIQKLICIGQKLTKENTHFVAFPDSMFSNGHTYDPYRKVNTYTLAVDYNQLREYIADFMNGTWPQKP